MIVIDPKTLDTMPGSDPAQPDYQKPEVKIDDRAGWVRLRNAPKLSWKLRKALRPLMDPEGCLIRLPVSKKNYALNEWQYRIGSHRMFQQSADKLFANIGGLETDSWQLRAVSMNDYHVYTLTGVGRVRLLKAMRENKTK